MYHENRKYCFSRSFLRKYVIKWVDVHPSVKNSVYSISIITWPTEWKLCRMILDIGAHSRSVPGFAISLQRALLGRGSWNLQFLTLLLLRGRLSWNCSMILDNCAHVAQSLISRFPPRGCCRSAPLEIFESNVRIKRITANSSIMHFRATTGVQNDFVRNPDPVGGCSHPQRVDIRHWATSLYDVPLDGSLDYLSDVAL